MGRDDRKQEMTVELTYYLPTQHASIIEEVKCDVKGIMLQNRDHLLAKKRSLVSLI